MDIITLEHVKKSFDGQEILKDFNLSVKEGEFLTVIGRSGCGKTTMLKLMNGLLTPASATPRAMPETYCPPGSANAVQPHLICSRQQAKVDT